jgi:multiple sugar transport system ATP-binding protein
VFLFDEPLSNLDAKMRVSTRTDISKLHARLEATMIYVTHDQVEAMTMGDRICVMKDGRIMQVAEPLELYNQPANVFVAGFIGSPPMNFFHGSLEKKGNETIFIEKNASGSPLRITLHDRLARAGAKYVGQPVIFGIRPEDVQDAVTVTDAAPGTTLDVKVEVSEPMGAETLLYLTTGAHSFIARVSPTDRFDSGQTIKVVALVENAHLFDVKTEEVITT